MENSTLETKTRTFSSFETEKDFIQTFSASVRFRAVTPGANTEEHEPTVALKQTLERAQTFPFLNEKLLSEAYIFPVLSEVYALFGDKISFFSGVRWETDVWDAADVAPVQLNGFCDFLLGGLPYMRSPKVPIICVVEAKKEDVESGTWQCAAELYACKMNNERAGLMYPFYYGCITTGKDWNFIRLNCNENVLYCDSYTYLFRETGILLGVWKWVIETQLAAAPKP